MPATAVVRGGAGAAAPARVDRGGAAAAARESLFSAPATSAAHPLVQERAAVAELKRREDLALDDMVKNLASLGDMAKTMNEEITVQSRMLDGVESKLDAVGGGLARVTVTAGRLAR